MSSSYTLLHTDGAARAGVLRLPHGEVNTPVFMPIATAGSIKGVFPRDVQECGASILLANTFHLMQRPGDERIKEYGDLHRFMNWSGPILTDSGGFQVWSLGKLRTLEERGVTFKSPVDGQSIFLSPEVAIQVQLNLGSDIMMCFDECIAYPTEKKQTAESTDLSVRWAARCKDAFDRRESQAKESKLFGIVQGGMFADLRRKCAEELLDIGFDGYALGGLSVGEPKEEMLRVVETTTPVLPADQPRYLMGVGTPSDLVEAVSRGIDMFDCVLPTRNGRNGQMFTSYGKINVRNAKYAGQQSAPDENCECYCCQNFSLGYIHHLFRCQEMLGPQLASLHNIFYYQKLLFDMREAIKGGKLTLFIKNFYNNQLKQC